MSVLMVLISAFAMLFSGVSPHVVVEENGIDQQNANTSEPAPVPMSLPTTLPIDTTTVASSTDDEQFPLMAFDSGGQLHYLYLKGKAVKNPVVSASNDLFTFSLPSTTLSTGDAWNPSMAIDDHGVIHLVWREKAQTGYKIMYSHSETDGSTWSSPQTVFFAAGPTDPNWGVSTDYPRLAVGRNNILHLVFTHDPTPQKLDPSGIYNGHPTLVKYTNRVNGIWSTPKQIGIARDFARPVAVANDVVYVVWQDWFADWALNIAISYNDGMTFTPQRVLVDRPGHSIHPDITVAPNGNVYLVFADDRTGRFRAYIKYSWDEGYTWSGDLALTLDIASALTPKVAASSTGEVYVVWRDDRYANPQVFLKGMNEKLGAISETRISMTSGSATAPQIKVDSFGNVHVMWQDDSSGNLDIMYATTHLRMDNQVSNMVSFINSLPDNAFNSTPSQVKNTLGNKLAVVDKDLDRIQGYVSDENMAMDEAQTGILSLDSSMSNWIIEPTALSTLMNLSKSASGNISVQNYSSATSSLDSIKKTVSSLPANAFNGSKSQATKEINGLVQDASKDVKDAGVERNLIIQHVSQPIDKLQNDILRKMDGFMGGDPADDWIVLESAQNTMFKYTDQLKISLGSAGGGTAGNVYIYGVQVFITGSYVRISWNVNWGGNNPILAQIVVKDSAGNQKFNQYWKPPTQSYFDVDIGSYSAGTYTYTIIAGTLTGSAKYDGTFGMGLGLTLDSIRFETLSTVDKVYVRWWVKWGPVLEGQQTYILYKKESDTSYFQKYATEVNPIKWPGLFEASFDIEKLSDIVYLYRAVAEGYDMGGVHQKGCLPSCTSQYRLVTGMQISNLHVENIGSNRADIVWNTNYDTIGTHRVYYHVLGGSVLSGNANSFIDQNTYLHRLTLTSLLASTEYEYWVYSKDNSGHESSTQWMPLRFKTHLEVFDLKSYGWFLPTSYGSKTGSDVQRFEWSTSLDEMDDGTGQKRCKSDSTDAITYTGGGITTTIHGHFSISTCKWMATSDSNNPFTQKLPFSYSLTVRNINDLNDQSVLLDSFTSKNDKDGDRLTDGQEYVGWMIAPVIYEWGTAGKYVYSSAEKDWSDTDSLSDYSEWLTYDTDPSNPDTDQDGLSDSIDPVPKNWDIDNDMVSDGIEYNTLRSFTTSYTGRYIVEKVDYSMDRRLPLRLFDTNPNDLRISVKIKVTTTQPHSGIWLRDEMGTVVLSSSSETISTINLVPNIQSYWRFTQGGNDRMLTIEVPTADRSEGDITIEVTVQAPTSMTNPDSDFDGLTDGIELYQKNFRIPGAPFVSLDENGDGVSDSNPLRPDIWVEIDWMEAKRDWNSLPIGCGIVGAAAVHAAYDAAPEPGKWAAGSAAAVLVGPSCAASYIVNIEAWDHRMSDEAQNKVKSAFFSHGIILHIDEGNMGGGNSIPHNDQLGFDDTGAPIDFYDLKWGTGWDVNNNGAVDIPGDNLHGYFNYKRFGIFHYDIFAHKRFNTDSSGVAYANDDSFMVADGTLTVGHTLLGQAGTFMHELGHNLGLTNRANNIWPAGVFRGIDNNFGSSYLSCMNYDYQTIFIDYSNGPSSNDDHDDWETLHLAGVTGLPNSSGDHK